MMPLRCFAHFMPPWREDLLFWSICMNIFKFFGTANFNFLNLFFVKFSAHENRFSFLNFSGWPCYYRVPQKKRTFRIIIPVLQSIQAHKHSLQAPSSLVSAYDYDYDSESAFFWDTLYYIINLGGILSNSSMLWEKYDNKGRVRLPNRMNFWKKFQGGGGVFFYPKNYIADFGNF